MMEFPNTTTIARIRDEQQPGKSMSKRLLHALCGCLLLAIPATASTQNYPDRPIRFVVPNPPGGGTDVLTRVVATKLAETLQWRLIVDNRPGAGGNIGLDLAAKSAPDGYTIVMGETSNLAINPALYSKLPYDSRKDFAPIALIGSVPLVLVVNSNKPYRSLADVVAAAKTSQLSFASAGSGTVGHLVGELLKRTAGIDLLHVPYKGAALALTDVVGGQVELFFASLPSAAPQVKAGRLRALAVTTAQRAQAMPELPTVAESGYRGFEASPWYGVLAPAGTPAAIVARLNTEITRVLQTPDIKARLTTDGVEIRGGSPEQFAALIKNELSKWAKVVNDSGAKVD
jgi:tripartite-type tricarboxylate transporter receptor subunit TctC